MQFHDNSRLLGHLSVALVIRLFQCYNTYKNDRVIAVLLVKSVAWIKKHLGEIGDITEIVDSLETEFNTIKDANRRETRMIY